MDTFFWQYFEFSIAMIVLFISGLLLWYHSFLTRRRNRHAETNPQPQSLPIYRTRDVLLQEKHYDPQHTDMGHIPLNPKSSIIMQVIIGLLIAFILVFPLNAFFV